MEYLLIIIMVIKNENVEQISKTKTINIRRGKEKKPNSRTFIIKE